VPVIRDLGTDDPLAADAYRVLVQLRPNLGPEQWARIREAAPGEALTFTVLVDDGVVRAVAGWRVLSTTHVGRKVYVDDLVTDEPTRSRGFGAALLAHLRERGRAAGCVLLDLDSGVHRHDAHRFYLRERLDIVGHHFAQQL
jgi:GNAT superfamily N-acetyltransferase